MTDRALYANNVTIHVLIVMVLPLMNAFLVIQL
jgi:hypothetical protein